MIKKILLLIYGLFSLFWLQAQSPGGVSGSTLWYRADAGVTVASGVSQWNNSAQSNYNLTQATAANRPAYNTTSNLINFNPSIRFDGVNDVVSAAGVPQNVTISGSNPYSTSQYVVYRQLSGSNPIYQHSNGSGGVWNIGAQSDGQLLVTNRFISTTAPSSNEVRLQGIDGTSNAASSYLNGALSSSTLTSTTSVSGTQPFWVGSGGTASFANVDMAEIVVYNTAQANRPRIESYLSLKYGITKSGNYQNSAASVVWNATTNTGYNNNIAGISRDDASGLNQKQSQSQNSGIQPVIGNGNIFDTNANNTNNFSADLSALVWGSDTGSTAFATSFAFGSLNTRMTRVWRVQETGTVGTVKVAIPASQIAASISQLNLVVSADATFDGTDTRTAMTLETLGGVQYYTATVDFSSGQFFTFAAYVTAPGGVLGSSLWVKADSGTSTTTDGAAISQWTDQSSLNNNAVQAVGSNQPAYKSLANNFNPAVSLTASSSQHFSLPSGFADFTAGATIYAIAKPTSTGSFARFIEFANGAPSDNLTFHRSGTTQTLSLTVYTGTTGAFSVDGVNGILNDEYSIYGAYIPSGAAASTVTGSVFRNGLSLNSSSTRVPNNINRTINYIGRSNWSGDAYFNGEFSEIIVYQSNQSSSRNRIESYLALKYGLTLDQTVAQNYVNSGSTAIWNATTNTGYNNNIAGIARDDASALNQKQSASVNSGIQPVIGNGNIFDTNANNTNNFTADLSALVWGSNTGSTSFATSFAFGSVNNRMARIWRVQETGTVGTVKVALPVSQIAGSISQLNLVVSADATFDGTDSRTAMTLETLGGVQYYTATVDFTSGQFFTFAAFVTAPGGVTSGLRIWHKADAGVTAASNLVTAWTNQTDGRQVINSGGTQRPTLVASGSLFNFNPYLDFTANTNTLNDTGATPFTADGDISFFTTLRPATVAGNDGQIFAVNRPGSTDVYDSFEWFHGGFFNENSAVFTNYSSSLIGLDQSILTFTHSGALNTSNGYRNLNVIVNSSTIAGQLGSGGYTFGSDAFAGGNNVAPIAQLSEHIAYNRVLSALEIQRVQTYLGIKIGVTLNQNHILSDGTSNIWNITTNTGYNNNIAGIARDDASALNQKQSASVNSGIQPVIGNGNIFDTNANNTNNFSADLSALVWGSDTGNTSFATSFVFGSVNNRMARIWRVQETGTVGTVKVALPASQISGSITQLNLVVSGDATFDGTDTRTAMTLETLGGIQYYTATVDFTSGQFFTFAALVTAPGGVTGEDLWLKADAGTGTSTDNTAITTWADQSGNANNVSQATAVNRPVYRNNSANLMNFNPTVSFDGTNDFMDATTFTINGTANTLFSAVKPNVVNLSAQDVLSFGALGLQVGGELRLNNATLEYSQNNTTFSSVTSGSVAVAQVPLLFGSSMSNTASGASVYQNNLAVATGAINQFPSAANLVSIGSRTLSSRAFYFNGLIPEVVTYNSLLTAAQRQRVNSYLAIKYGVTLDQSTVLNFNNGDFNTNNFNYWLVSGNVTAVSGNAAFNGSDTTPNGVISQSISTVNGQSYTVGGDVRRIGAGAGTPRVRLDVIDNSTSVVIATQNITASSGTATPFTPLAFTGNGNSFTIRFTDTSTATVSLDIVLDNVTLTPNASATGMNYLNSASGVIWDAAANTGYNNNIAGIARDDVSALNQKQSQSVNSGIQPVIGNGNIFDTNANNTNNFSADLSALVWGSDTGSTAFATSFAFGGVNNRMARIWKVQETGTVGTVKVALPVSQLALSANTTALALVVSTDAVFDGTDTRTAMTLETLGGVQYYTATVDFTSGQFFTFAALLTAPGGVTGSSLWLKADAGTGTSTDNTAIATWADQSGNSNDVSQGTAASRPLYRINGVNMMNFNPIVSFDGTNDYITAGTFTINSSSNTLFSAIRPNVVNVIQEVLGYGAATSPATGGEFRLNNATLEYGQANPTFSAIGSGSVLSAGTPLLFGSSMNNVANGASLFQNNRTLTTGTITQIPAAANLVSIGSRTIGSIAFFFNGAIPEVVAYNTVLTAVQRQRVNSYLAIKYGITIDQTAATDYLASDGTTIFWNAAANAAYNQNIAGIGRDDLSALYQKQSQSINASTSQVVMSLGTVAATNQANANTIAADRQFFIWGDDNGSLNTQVSTGNNTYTYRFTRVWKTQNTGTFAQNMTVYYPVSAFGNASASTVALLYGTTAASLSNGTASAIAQSGTTTISGVSHYAFTVSSAQVGNMQFFSFTGTQTSPGGVITGLRQWLKADAGTSTTTDGAGVATWSDQSGNGFDALQSSAALAPLYRTAAFANKYNFNPYLDYSGGKGSYNAGTSAAIFSSNNDNASIFVMSQGYTTGGSGIGSPWAVGFNTSGTTYLDQGKFGFPNSSTAMTWGRAAGSLLVTSSGIDDQNTANQIYVVDWNGATATTKSIRARQNGRILNSAANTNPLTIGTNTTNQFGISDGGNGSIVGDNNMGTFFTSEMIVYNTQLTELEMSRVSSYLAIKYGKTLSRDNSGNGTAGETITGSILEGDYVASDGTTRIWNSDAAYQNNIAGIGRDDLSALHQKQSQSVNTGSQVVMALGTAAATNQANANTIATDRQFFIWGDDNGSLTTQVSTGNTTYTYRFTRAWKTQNTGTFAQNLMVYYPVSAFGNASASTVALLYGATAASLSNGTASAIAQSGTTTINGVSHYAFTIPSAQVANMQFFSFAGTQTSPGGAVGENLWYRADNGVSTATGVSQWDNSAQPAYNLTQATVANQPAYNTTSNTINFNPSIRFDGANDHLSVANVPLSEVASGSNPYSSSHYVVYRGLSNVNAPLYASASSGVSAWNISSSTNGSVLITNRFVPTSAVAVNETRLQNFDGTSNAASSYLNGTLLSSALTSSTSTSGGSPSFTVGSNFPLTAPYSNADIAEIVVYNVNQPSSRLQIESYLGIKYGLTLGHNYLSSDGTTTYDVISHSNNIAGIGRDDLTALYQKQSQSQNSGSQVVMSLGTVAASNQANANTIPTDKQFFIWGDDNGSLSTFVSTGNVSYPSRFTRVWKTQNTGTFAENMTVYYPVSAFGTSLASSVGLLYGSSAASLSNGSASVIPQSGTTTINGVSYYAFTVPSAQIANMQFFSFTGATVCYKPAVTVGTTLDAKHGITALSRAGTSGDNWPMVRKGAWTVLEAKTKGFVINRLTAAQIAAIPPANLVEGMMVYDTTNNCMKVYTSTDGGTTFNWQCITTQTCPD